MRVALSTLDAILEALPLRVRSFASASLFLIPAFGLLIAFGIAPMVYAVYLSTFDLSGATALPVGSANYREALGGDAFWNSVAVTIYFAVGTVPLTIIASLALAMAAFRSRRFQGFFRTAFFLPYVTSTVAAAMIWRVMFEPRYGIANRGFELMGLAPQSWLLEPRGVLHLLTDGAIAPGVGPSLALCCVIAFEIWRSSGFMVVVILAGLSTIPKELDEAAAIDGARSWQSFRHITLPMLSPTLFFLVIVGTIGAFQAFSGFYALTGGRGPLDTTQNLTVYIYANLYEFGRLGYGAAVSVLLFAATAVLTLLQWRVARARVYYQ